MQITKTVDSPVSLLNTSKLVRRILPVLPGVSTSPSTRIWTRGSVWGSVSRLRSTETILPNGMVSGRSERATITPFGVDEPPVHDDAAWFADVGKGETGGLAEGDTDGASPPRLRGQFRASRDRQYGCERERRQALREGGLCFDLHSSFHLVSEIRFPGCDICPAHLSFSRRHECVSIC